MKMYKGILLIGTMFVAGLLSASNDAPMAVEKSSVPAATAVSVQAEPLQGAVAPVSESSAVPMTTEESAVATVTSAPMVEGSATTAAPVAAAPNAEAISTTAVLAEEPAAPSGSTETVMVEETQQQVSPAPMTTAAQSMVLTYDKLDLPVFVKFGDKSAQWEKIEPRSKRSVPFQNGSIWVSFAAQDQDKSAQEIVRKNSAEMPTEIKISKRGFWRGGKELTVIYGWNVFKRESFKLNEYMQK